MDWRDKIIELFPPNCEYRCSELWFHCERFGNNANPEFTDAEAMTVYLRGLINGFAELKKIHGYANGRLKEWFPPPPPYPGFTVRPNRLCSVFQQWPEHSRHDFPVIGGLANIRLIDSMPVVMAEGGGRYTAKAAPELAGSGCCPSEKMYCCGMKTQVAAFKKTEALPIPEYPGVGGADGRDPNMLKYLAHDLHDAGIYAGEAYCGCGVDP